MHQKITGIEVYQKICQKKGTFRLLIALRKLILVESSYLSSTVVSIYNRFYSCFSLFSSLFFGLATLFKVSLPSWISKNSMETSRNSFRNYYFLHGKHIFSKLPCIFFFWRDEYGASWKIPLSYSSSSVFNSLLPSYSFSKNPKIHFFPLHTFFAGMLSLLLSFITKVSTFSRSTKHSFQKDRVVFKNHIVESSILKNGNIVPLNTPGNVLKNRDYCFPFHTLTAIPKRMARKRMLKEGIIPYEKRASGE